MRDINIPRHLGIPHPESYALQALAIKKHWLEIQAHSAKPSLQVSRVYVRHVGGGRIFEMNYKGDEKFSLRKMKYGGWQVRSLWLTLTFQIVSIAFIHTQYMGFAR